MNFLKRIQNSYQTKVTASFPKFTVEIEYDCDTEDDWDSLSKELKAIKGVKAVKAISIDGQPVD